MKHLMVRCAALAVLVFAVAALSNLGAAEQKTDAKKGGKALTISEIMKKSHAKGGARPAILKELAADTTNWDVALTKTKDLYLLAGDLERNTPPLGEKSAWDQMAKKYVALVSDLEKAVEKKDLDAAKDAAKSINNACAACHKNHRKMEDE